MSASAIIADVRSLLAGEPVYLAGSLVAEETYGKSNAHSDVDLFCPTDQVLIAVGQKLLCNGYKLDDRFDRVWHRWLRYGFKRWHTNSLRLMSPAGVETNLVYKLTDGHPTTSLGQVLESFDFGLLATGYDLEHDQYRDMRAYLFPGLDPDGPLPMMPNKRDNWRNGFISQYNALREPMRYAKYHGYGYDLSAVKDDLVTGYQSAASYLVTHFDPEKQQLGKIYEAISFKIDDDDIDDLVAASKKIDYKDSLDVIMEALE
jgi:hypothetical protein